MNVGRKFELEKSVRTFVGTLSYFHNVNWSEAASRRDCRLGMAFKREQHCEVSWEPLRILCSKFIGKT